MMSRPPPTPKSAETREPGFAARVCAAFGLDADGLVLDPLPASSTRLWSLRTETARFVVKEFPFDEPGRADSLAAAAEFEYGLWRSAQLTMPEPVLATDGRLICWLMGSRGSVVAVRAHRWLAGMPVPVPPSARTAVAAGTALAVIQESGATRETTPSGSLRWWTVDPFEVASRLQTAGLLPPAVADLGRTSLDSALALIAAGERLSGRWVYTHCDHKPENSLLSGAKLAVLDWDECGLCHPRLEAAESALRWAGVDGGEPRREVFRAFMRGYESRAGELGALTGADFAKWVAALAGWFSVTGARALGRFDDTGAERAGAARMAADALEALARTLASVHTWANSFSA